MKAYRETILTEEQRVKLKKYLDSVNAYLANPEFETKTIVEGYLWWKKEVTLYKPKNIPSGISAIYLDHWLYNKCSFSISPTKKVLKLSNLYRMIDAPFLIDDELYNVLLDVLVEEIYE